MSDIVYFCSKCNGQDGLVYEGCSDIKTSRAVYIHILFVYLHVTAVYRDITPLSIRAFGTPLVVQFLDKK